MTGVWNDQITNTNYPDGNFFTENTNTNSVTSVKSDVNRIKLRNLDALVPPTNLVNWMGPLQLEVGDIITIRHTVNSQEVGYYRVSSSPLQVPPVGSAGTVIDVVHIESDGTPFNPTEDYFVGYVKTGNDGNDGNDGQDGQDGAPGLTGLAGNSALWEYNQDSPGNNNSGQFMIYSVPPVAGNVYNTWEVAAAPILSVLIDQLILMEMI